MIDEPPGEQPSARIAVMLPDLRPGGAERLHVGLASEWLRQGFDVDFVLMRRRGELVEIVPEGVRIVELGVDQVRHVVGPVRRYLALERPCVLLAAMWPLTVSAVLAARSSRAGVRVVVSDHSILSESYRGRGLLHRAMLRTTLAAGYRAADERVVVSRGVARDIAALSWIPTELFRVVYNPAAGVNTCSPQHRVPDLIRGMQGPMILSVGNMKPVKDHAALIAAFSRLPSTTATLCILGEGKLRPQLESQVRSLKLEARVLLPGFAMDTVSWYRAANLFVLSSRHEGFGNVIVEAMEQGVPVVSTDCPAGPREILCDGKYGRLVPVGDVDALAEAMQAALSETPDREALKARARDFSVEKIAEEYLDIMLPEWRDERHA